jgi:hypothetical protein
MKEMKRFLTVLALVACGGAPAPLPSVAAGPTSQTPTQSPSTVKGLETAKANALLEAAWAARGVEPAPECDDASFARRATLDVLGTIPSPAEATNTIASQRTTSDKRRALVDRLLDDPRYADHWANYWDDVLMGQTRSAAIDRDAFRGWLKQAFAKNMHWDQMVREIVAATGQNGNGNGKVYPMGAMPMMDTGEMKAESTPAPAGAGVPINGAVNFALRFQDAPQDLAGTASRVFLGVQIQCAQCHDHKTEAWKMTDFQKFAAATLHFQTEALDKAGNGLRRVVVTDSKKVNGRVAKNPELETIAKSTPTALDGTALAQAEKTRGALAAWMTKPDNPWFARAFVNRMWGHFMGRGFSDPVDDLRSSNPTEATPLLDALSAEFVRSGFDIKSLIRTITQIRSYHLAASSVAKTDSDNHLWGNFKLVPLGPEELLNAVFAATHVDQAATKAGVTNMPQLKAQLVRSFSTLFDVDEEFDAQGFEGSISQALALLNGSLVNIGSRSLEGTTVSAILKDTTTDEDAVRRLYLQILSRQPTDQEIAKGAKYMRETPAAPREPKKPAKNQLDRAAMKDKGPRDPRKEAFEDLAWALLNSSEFAFNH